MAKTTTALHEHPFSDDEVYLCAAHGSVGVLVSEERHLNQGDTRCVECAQQDKAVRWRIEWRPLNGGHTQFGEALYFNVQEAQFRAEQLNKEFPSLQHQAKPVFVDTE